MAAAVPLDQATLAVRQQAAQAIEQGIPSAKASVDAQSGRRWVVAQAGALAAGDGAGLPAAAAFAPADPDRGLKAFLDTHPGYFGHGSAVLRQARRDGESLSPSGLRTVAFQQRAAGIPVSGATLVAAYNVHGQLFSVSATTTDDVPEALPAIALDLAQAVAIACNAVGVTAGALVIVDAPADDDASRFQSLRVAGVAGQVHAFLTFLPSAGGASLCWRISLIGADRKNAAVFVDAQNGEVRRTHNLTSDCAIPGHRHGVACDAAHAEPAHDAATAARALGQRLARRDVHDATPAAPPGPVTAGLVQAFRMLVYPVPNESPTPQQPLIGGTPATISQSTITESVVDLVASPEGWIASTYSKGNNVDAYLDLANDNTVVTTDRVQGTGSPLAFSFAIDLTKAPSDTTYRKGAVTQLFYLSNWYHDQLYRLGFDEASRNFQTSNFGKGGAGNDHVLAECQDGGDTDNANFSADVDGVPGRMQMYTWTAPNPDRDGDLDATIVIHELTHGTSNRLVGGGDISLGGSQAGGMGEGWSDFYAITLLAKPGDPLNGSYGVGSYAVQNYTRGIRSAPYSTDLAKNPYTLKGIQGITAVHSVGTYWCTFLWEVRCALVAKHGFDPGNRIALQLVTDGMKLTPSFPTLIEARDAILLADQQANGGANLRVIWDAFSKRGLGPGAVVPADGTTGTIVEDKTKVPDLLVTIGSSLSLPRLDFVGDMGGPFAPGTITVSLRNLGSGSLAVSASASATWITITPTSANLAPGSTQAATIALTAAANSLQRGHYETTLRIDGGSGGSVVVPITLDITNGYALSSTSYAWIATTGHTAITLADDAVSAARAIGFTFPFYRRSATQVYIGSNGLIGFTQNGLDAFANAALPRADSTNDAICALWDDLYPEISGAKITQGLTGTAPNRIAVFTYAGVPQVSARTSTFTFQILLYENTGDIVVQYQEIRPGLATYGAGRSASIGVEHRSGLAGTQLSFNGSTPLANLTAYRFALRTVTGPGDLNGDRLVNADDLSVVLAHFGQTSTSSGFDFAADSDRNNTVNADDFLVVLANFGKSYP